MQRVETAGELRELLQFANQEEFEWLKPVLIKMFNMKVRVRGWACGFN